MKPFTYDAGVVAKVLEGLTAGKPLKEICRQPNMVHEATFRDWQRADIDGLAAKVATARRAGCELLAEELVQIADDGANDRYIDENGVQRIDYDVVQRSKLRVDTRKWLLSKMLPAVYGDKSSVELSVTSNLADRLEAARKRDEIEG